MSIKRPHVDRPAAAFPETGAVSIARAPGLALPHVGLDAMTAKGPNETGQTDADRDAFGRFTHGNQAAVGAGGNAGWMRRVREAFQDVVTPSEVAEVWRRIVQQAKEGEPHAQALVVRYCGAPPTREESSAENQSPLVLFGIDREAMREGRWPGRPALPAPEPPCDVDVEGAP